MEPTGADRFSADRFQPPAGADRQDEQGRRAARPHIAPPFFAGGRAAPARAPAGPPAAAPEARQPSPPPAAAPPQAPRSAAEAPSMTGTADAEAEFPWEAPVPELLLTDVVEEPGPVWSEAGHSAVDEPADDFMAGAGIGDYEHEPEFGGYEAEPGVGLDDYGDERAGRAAELEEAPSLPEDAFFVPEPIEPGGGRAADAADLARELEGLADGLRRDGLDALGRALRGEQRLQALVAAVLSAYRAGTHDGD